MLIIATLATVVQYINVSNQRVVHIKFTRCYMSHRLQLFKKKKKKKQQSESLNSGTIVGLGYEVVLRTVFFAAGHKVKYYWQVGGVLRPHNFGPL